MQRVPDLTYEIALVAASLRVPSSPDQPRDTIVFAIRCGRNTDTLAAMAGAFAGALNGASALPEAQLDRIEDRRCITTSPTRSPA